MGGFKVQAIFNQQPLNKVENMSFDTQHTWKNGIDWSMDCQNCMCALWRWKKVKL